MATNAGQFLRIKSLSKSPNIITSASKHNLREIQAELGFDGHINPAKTHLNEILHGPNTAAGVAAMAKQLMLDGGITKPRKNASRGIEVIISLPTSHNCDQSLFFANALQWATDFYCVPVISAVLHRDESEPHIHILLLPILDGKLQGHRVMGGRAKVYEAQSSFHSEVGKRHGLRQNESATRTSASVRGMCASLVITALQSSPGLLDSPDVESALLRMIGRDPEPLMLALGLSVPSPEPREKNWIATFIKNCPEKKPAKSISKKNAIAVSTPKESNRYLCVSGSAESSSIEAVASPVPAIDSAATVVQFSEYQRVRDGEQSAMAWDSDRGEFVSMADPSKPSIRAGAQREVDRMLKRIV